MQTFTHTICITDLNDYETLAQFYVDPHDNIVRLMRVLLGTLWVNKPTAARIIGNDLDRQLEIVQAWWDETGSREADTDARLGGI